MGRNKEGPILAGPKQPFWQCGICGQDRLWACRIECSKCKNRAPGHIVGAARKQAKAAVAAGAGVPNRKKGPAFNGVPQTAPRAPQGVWAVPKNVQDSKDKKIQAMQSELKALRAKVAKGQSNAEPGEDKAEVFDIPGDGEADLDFVASAPTANASFHFSERSMLDHVGFELCLFSVITSGGLSPCGMTLTGGSELAAT